MTPISLEKHHAAARALLQELHLTEVEQLRPKVSGHGSSLPLVAKNDAGRQFLLKYYLPPAADKVLPFGVRAEDYSRRESGFYRLLDSIDPARREFPAPHTIAVGPGDPAPWLLLEWLPAAPGPREEVIFTLLGRTTTVLSAPATPRRLHEGVDCVRVVGIPRSRASHEPRTCAAA